MRSGRDLDCRRLRFGEFTLDAADERLTGPAGPVKIGNKAFRVLLALIEQDGRLLTKEALFSSVWDGTIVGESALTSVIKELRRALGDESRTPRYIQSVYGRGYRFLAATEAAEPGAAETPEQPDAHEAPPSQPPVVLVSRFNDLAVRGDHPHCGAQLREEVLSGLARFREIQLVAEDMDDGAGAGAARRAQRGYRVDASLLPDGATVKVVARVSRLSDGVVIWSESLSLGDGGIGSGVERIVRRIVGSALPAMDADIGLGLPDVGNAFYDRYLIAKRRSLAPATVEEARAAADELERLIAERPDFGLAYPPLVRLYNTDFGWTAFGSSGAAERGRALELAKAGLAADRGNVHAYTVLAFCHLYHGENRRARDCLEQALDLNPYNPVRVNEVAAAMIYLGDFDRARSLFELGLHLQRFADDEFLEDRGKLQLMQGDHAAARDSLQSVTRHTIWSELYLALSEILLGEPGGGRPFAAWTGRVADRWHERRPPSADELQSWVRHHHPFAGKSGEPLFAAVAQALATAPPRVPEQARG